MIVQGFPVGSLQCNCILLGDEDTGDALIVDPGEEADRILEEVRKAGLKPIAVVNTHTHFDHVCANREIAEKTGAKVYMHREDLFLYRALPMQAAFFGMRAPLVSPVDFFLKDGDGLKVGGISVEVLHTPGHTPGSLTFRVPRKGEPPLLFTGDTLFMGSIGRTDLWGGSMDTLLKSIKDRLLTNDDACPVIPGHGPATTIGQERRINPFLTDL